LYRWVRHPQYVALALMGLGVLLHWPRIAVLVAFVTMLFLYYFLARSEERRCLEQFGDSYREYSERTWMFLPWLGPRGACPPGRERPGAGWQGVLAGIAAWALIVGASVWGAYRLRDYSLAHISHSSNDDVAILSPALLSPQELTQAVEVARQNPEVSGRLAAASTPGSSRLGARARLLVYVVPTEWRLPDVPMEKQSGGGHYTPKEFARNKLKVLFTRPVMLGRSGAEAQGDGIIRATVKREPIVLARVDTQTRSVEAIEHPPATVRWGDIPTPLF
jgi:hypothetical protein